jgi:hypothetical protein
MESATMKTNSAIRLSRFYGWRATLAMMVVLMLSACAGRPVQVSVGELQQKSIVVGRIDWVDWRGASDDLPAEADLRISGRLYRGVVHHGYIVIALPPGSYTLDSMVYTDGIRTYTKALGETFHVSTGKNLNLGLLVLWFGREATRSGYHIVPIDNTRQMIRHLRHVEPDVWAVVRERPFERPRYTFLDPRKLEALRKEIAIRTFVMRQFPWNRVAGNLGTVARVDRAKSPSARFTVIPSDTFSDFRSCFHARRYINCVAREADNTYRLLNFDGKHIVYHPIPPGFTPVRVFRSRSDTIYLLDSAMRIRSLAKGSTTWKGFDPKGFPGLKSNLSGYAHFLDSDNGLFINAAMENGAILYRDRATGDYSYIPNPDREAKYWNLLDRPEGLYLGGHRELGGGTFLYFRPSGSGVWQRHRIPFDDCIHRIEIRNPHDPKSGILVRCGKHLYVTTDRGGHWTELEPGRKRGR